MWGPIIGGAGILAFILTIFAFYNGRATRRLILGEERRTQEISRQEEERTREIFEREEKATREIMEEGQRRTQQILERLEQGQARMQLILGRQEKLLEKLSEQHNTMMEMLRIAQSRGS